ncbi:MAG: TVP38/TMEM64 family protein [Bacillota bacterium]
MKNKKTILGIILFIVIIYMNYEFKRHNIISFDNFNSYKIYLLNFVDQNLTISKLIFTISYILIISLGLPGVLIMTFTGGFLFNFFNALIMIVFSSTIGAIINFITSRYFLKDFFKQTFSKTINKINKKIDSTKFKNLLILRIIPFFPYSIVNFSLGISNILLSKFIFITILGKIPGTLLIIYASKTFTKVKNPKDLATPKIIISTILLIIFLILPHIYKKINNNKF